MIIFRIVQYWTETSAKSAQIDSKRRSMRGGRRLFDDSHWVSSSFHLSHAGKNADRNHRTHNGLLRESVKAYGLRRILSLR